MKKFLRKWLKDQALQDFDMRTIIDWDYYKERVAGTIQKIVTIPAALQKCLNPVPKIKYPEWLHKRIKEEDEKYKQKDMKFFFQMAAKKEPSIRDIEDTVSMKPLQITQAKVAPKKSEPTVSKYETLDDCPSPEGDFGEWLKY